ncbi:HK97 gp10 family phage protein [Paenibacillus sp. SI8]|uniref:HK97 gp10 family phage protein n=1 Tax=unclassified Paenibacillus TaxID=185978 RepID=UPI003465F683
MAKSFELDISAFLHALDDAGDTIADGAKRGMHKALEEWQRDAVNLAPLYVRKGPKDKRPSGALRASIHTKVEGDGLDVTGEISAAVVETDKRGRRFDYAYYLHEVYPQKHGRSFKHPSTSGTIPEFIETPAVYKSDQWLHDIENEIKDELKRKGW